MAQRTKELENNFLDTFKKGDTIQMESDVGQVVNVSKDWITVLYRGDKFRIDKGIEVVYQENYQDKSPYYANFKTRGYYEETIRVFYSEEAQRAWRYKAKLYAELTVLCGRLKNAIPALSNEKREEAIVFLTTLLEQPLNPENAK